jgi:hypothetical protein
MQLLARRPALRQIVSEAARALAHLDAGRLEELALSCQALNRDLHRAPHGDLPPINQEERAQLAAEAQAARRDMEIFARVLEATRANVQVIERLRELRSGRVEYTLGPAADLAADFGAHRPAIANREKEGGHGND